jgi:hypothetical protein
MANKMVMSDAHKAVLPLRKTLVASRRQYIYRRDVMHGGEDDNSLGYETRRPGSHAQQNTPLESDQQGKPALAWGKGK